MEGCVVKKQPPGDPQFFSDTFFRHPDELRDEVAAAGFADPHVLAVEGIGYMMKEFDEHWSDAACRDFLLEVIAKTETEAKLLGASPHLMCVGRKSYL